MEYNKIFQNKQKITPVITTYGAPTAFDAGNQPLPRIIDMNLQVQIREAGPI